MHKTCGNVFFISEVCRTLLTYFVMNKFFPLKVTFFSWEVTKELSLFLSFLKAWFFIIFIFFHCFSSTIVSIFKPHTSPHTTHLHLPPLNLPSLALSMCPLYMFLDGHYPQISFSSLLSSYCQFVLSFSVSGCILLACLFCWLGFTYRWDHVVFLFYCLAYFI